MMHESKGQCIGKAPSLHLFHTTLGSYSVIATHKAHIPIRLMPMHMLLDHTLLGHVGGGKWPGNEAKTMPCTFMTLS